MPIATVHVQYVGYNYIPSYQNHKPVIPVTRPPTHLQHEFILLREQCDRTKHQFEHLEIQIGLVCASCVWGEETRISLTICTVQYCIQYNIVTMLGHKEIQYTYKSVHVPILFRKLLKRTITLLLTILHTDSVHVHSIQYHKCTCIYIMCTCIMRPKSCSIISHVQYM